MNIRYDNVNPPSNAYTFQQLVSGRWYCGLQTGQLYFYYRSPEGKPRLLRCDDDQDCTSRYQRGGTFRPVEVTVVVHDGVAA